MAIPLKYQHRVLFWGIFGALVLAFAGLELLAVGVDPGFVQQDVQLGAFEDPGADPRPRLH